MCGACAGASPAVNQGKRLHADWSWTLGEAAQDIRSASYRQPGMHLSRLLKSCSASCLRMATHTAALLSLYAACCKACLTWRRIAADAKDIIVLGEHAIVLLDGRGRLVWQRRLEYHPAALTMPQVCKWMCLCCLASELQPQRSADPTRRALFVQQDKQLPSACSWCNSSAPRANHAAVCHLSLQAVTIFF